MPSLNRLPLLVVLAMLLPACASLDEHEFKSTVYSPKTVELYDTVSKELLFRYAVPVYYKLKLNFDRPQEIEWFRSNPEPPTQMSWNLVDLRQPNDPVEKGQILLNGMPVELKMVLRPSPEYPPYLDPPANVKIGGPAVPPPLPGRPRAEVFVQLPPPPPKAGKVQPAIYTPPTPADATPTPETPAAPPLPEPEVPAPAES